MGKFTTDLPLIIIIFFFVNYITQKLIVGRRYDDGHGGKQIKKLFFFLLTLIFLDFLFGEMKLAIIIISFYPISNWFSCAV